MELNSQKNIRGNKRVNRLCCETFPGLGATVKDV